MATVDGVFTALLIYKSLFAVHQTPQAKDVSSDDITWHRLGLFVNTVRTEFYFQPTGKGTLLRSTDHLANLSPIGWKIVSIILGASKPSLMLCQGKRRTRPLNFNCDTAEVD